MSISGTRDVSRSNGNKGELDMTVYAELTKATKVPPFGDGDDEQEFLKKLLAKADKVPEKVYNNLTEGAQQWINDAIDATGTKDDLPVPDGMGEADEEDDADDEVEEEAPRTKKVSRGIKANAKAAKTEKKAKAAKATPKDVKPAKGAKAAKTAKSKGNGNAAGGKRGKGTPPPFPLTAKIKVLKKSPHREGSLIADRYSNIKSGMTCAQARDAGLSWLDLKCDVDRGNLEIK